MTTAAAIRNQRPSPKNRRERQSPKPPTRNPRLNSLGQFGRAHSKCVDLIAKIRSMKVEESVAEKFFPVIDDIEEIRTILVCDLGHVPIRPDAAAMLQKNDALDLAIGTLNGASLDLSVDDDWHKERLAEIDATVGVCKTALGRDPRRKVKPGTCRICGCTEDRGCRVEGIAGACSWQNEEHTLCTNPACLTVAGFAVEAGAR